MREHQLACRMRKGVVLALAIACSLFTEGALFAQGDPLTEETGGQATPPIHFRNRRTLSDFDLARKREGRYFIGLPLANFDPSTGIGFGARAYMYLNGSKSDGLFKYTPYQHRIFLQYFQTTKGLTFHWLDYDGLVFGNGRFRVRGQFIYMRNTQQHYFGLGNAANGDLSVSGLGNFSTFGAMEDALRPVDGNGVTRSRYNHYDLRRPFGLVGVETAFFGGLIKGMVGAAAIYNDIRDYSGSNVTVQTDAGETQARMGTTRLAEDCNQNTIIGCAGGWDNFFRFGLLFDTRDYEPDPNSGVFADFAMDLGSRALGADYEYARFLIAARHFYSPIPSIADLVLATRGTLQWHTKGAPFFTQPLFPFTDDPRSGLGGHRTLRGFKQDRFVGRASGLLNFELRWTTTRFNIKSQDFGVIVVPFIDTGRTFDDIGEFTLEDWHLGYGGALRLAWNQATLISIDYGRSSEDSGIYINFAHMF